MDQENPYARPESPLDTASPLDRASPEPAFLLSRLAAKAIDSLPFAGIFLFQFPNLSTDLKRAIVLSGIAPILANASVGLVALAFLVNLVLFGMNGQTIGKRVLGIKVVRTDGSPCRVGRWILRRTLPFGLLGKIPVAGPIALVVGWGMALGKERRCLHDLLADTIVIKV